MECRIFSRADPVRPTSLPWNRGTLVGQVFESLILLMDEVLYQLIS